jgi:hypothetical protein
LTPQISLKPAGCNLWALRRGVQEHNCSLVHNVWETPLSRSAAQAG